MPRATVSRSIDAPLDEVFRTVSEIEHFSKAIPHIVNVEFLSDAHTGVGARFRETRDMNGRKATVELEVTEYVENERVRIVSDTHGTVWDTVFTVAPTTDGLTELKLVMDVNAYKLLPRLMNVFIMGKIKSALESDLDSVKEYCEA